MKLVINFCFFKCGSYFSEEVFVKSFKFDDDLGLLTIVPVYGDSVVLDPSDFYYFEYHVKEV